MWEGYVHWLTTLRVSDCVYWHLNCQIRNCVYQHTITEYYNVHAYQCNIGYTYNAPRQSIQTYIDNIIYEKCVWRVGIG